MKKTYYTNIQKKKLCNRNNGELKTLPRFDFQMEDYFSVIFVDSLNKIIEIDPTDQFYIAGGLDVMKDSENLLFYSEDFTLENSKLTFTIDTYTDNYLKHIKNTNTPIYLEIGILNEKKTILLQDIVLAEPRVYLDGVAPTNIEEYYTKEQIDEKLAAVIVEQSDPIYTADKPNLALKSEIPTKTSDLQNDSGFITADDIPEVQINETDPIYTADKPNIALKSELFSKDYNDLANKPDLYTPKTDGDGSKFLADDGTYKTVQGGSDVDLSWYETTGNINFVTNDANGNMVNRFSQQAGYFQIGMTNTNLIDLYGNYLKWYQRNNQSYPYCGVDFSSATEFKLPENTTINGNKISTGGGSADYVNLPMKYDLQNDYGYFQADFSLNYVVQKYLNTYAISDGILTFNINAGTATENQCPTVEVMIPYTADITTFVFQSDIQQIQIPQSITYNSEYTYNYAVFVARSIHGKYYVNYSYSFGENE